MNYRQSSSHYSHLPLGLSKLSPNPFTAHPLPELEISGYHLRTIRTDDLATWCDYLKQSAVTEHWSWQVNSPQNLQQFVQNQDWSQNLAQIKFAIADCNDQLIGTIGFHTFSQQHLSAEIAYDLSPSHWGKGIVTAACRSLTNWAHQKVDLVRVQACVLDSNTRSLQVLQRCDFEREGLLKSYKQVRGQSRDFWVMSRINPKSK
ncbi:GNAT family N-acetyltransferase [Undibacterium seohonense]|uniref:GNAT family N-acetyltransferase n=1 Tax=Undibacterium seohonense TaxID=1344950 RepID=A0ABR6X7U7_9BURK|nr:GNAT family protein [Undibacterium seohonense]MBC3808798.1 GNAT family N-acetyltransferase [Undibacterium seohonense]